MASATTSMGVSLTGMCTDQRLETFLQYRPLLLSIAYRMLGSMSDAEDMLQESFLRWQQSSETDVRCPKAFLVTVITRLCINQLQSARVQREQYFGEWLPEPVVSSQGSDPSVLPQMDESLSIAFLVILRIFRDLEGCKSDRGELPADFPQGQAAHQGNPPPLRCFRGPERKAGAGVHVSDRAR
jgi:DNA-directed RNA polymerase specialized sigma24 family protein